MTQQDAAFYLQISVRSLQRYVQKRRLTVRYEQGKTRRVPIYDEAEISALKSAFFARPVFRQSRASGENLRPYSFRLLPADIEKLAEEAVRYGMPPSVYARHLVQIGLESALQGKVTVLDQELSALKQDLVALRQALDTFKTEFTDTTEIVLEYAGMEAGEARHWTNVNLRAQKQKS